MRLTRIVQFRTTLFTLSFLLVFGLAAFAEEQAYQAVSEAGNTYRLTFAEETLEVLKPLHATLSFTAVGGNPVSDAMITCSLSMPAMAMPKNVPPLKPSGDAGHYEGIFLLTMGGLWHVEISTVTASGQKDFAVIPVVGVVSGGEADNSVDAQLELLFQNKTE